MVNEVCVGMLVNIGELRRNRRLLVGKAIPSVTMYAKPA